MAFLIDNCIRTLLTEKMVKPHTHAFTATIPTAVHDPLPFPRRDGVSCKHKTMLTNLNLIFKVSQIANLRSLT